MTKFNREQIYRIYKVLVTILILAAGVCLILGCLSIYASGDQPYSREAVAKAFSVIAIPIYLCIGFIAAGFILELFFPLDAKKRKTPKSNLRTLELLTGKKDMNKLSQEHSDIIYNERKRRTIRRVINLVLAMGGAVVFLVYALNPNNFHQSEINASMIAAMKVLFPCLILPFGFGIYTFYANEKSFGREIQLIKPLPAANSKKEAEQPTDSSKKAVSVLRIALLLASAGILVYGFVSGGTADVLTKAVNICTECIGLG